MNTPEAVLSKLFGGPCFDVLVTYVSTRARAVEVTARFTYLGAKFPPDVVGSISVTGCTVETLRAEERLYRCTADLLQGPETQEILRSLCGDS